jgi:UDP-glucose 4-epimerase
MTDLSPGHLSGATVAVTGASGNLGTALLRRLTAPDSGVAEVRGLARRQPPDVAPYDGARWYTADLGDPASESTMHEFLDGADAVVHLAWAIQPGRHPDRLRTVNVDGTGRVARAAAAAGVEQVVHLSSVGAYTAAAVGQVVGEDWPTTGIPTSQYSRDKADAEVTVRHALGSAAVLSVVRPTLVLQPDAGSEIGRYFLGPLLFGAARLLPGRVARMLPLPLPELTVGFVHADDVADALVRSRSGCRPG